VQREEHLLLAGEVEVDRALGEPRGLRDLGHARHAVGVLEEKGLGGVEEGVAPLLLVALGDGALLDGHK
jgi:hypothetical protein